MKTLWCDNCQQANKAVEAIRTETYPVKGESIEIEGRFMVCSVCEEIVYYNEFEEKNLKTAYDKYRQQKGLLGPEDIVNIRKKYKLSQRGMAALLGWSPTTIARYEGGAIPSVANNEQLKRFASDFEYARQLYRKSHDKLNPLEARRAKSIFENSKSDEETVEDSVQWLSRFYNSKIEVFRGNQQFDIDTAACMIAFFCQQEKISKSKLMKLLFYADFHMYREHGKSISGLVYCHNHFGPIPLHHGMLLDCLLNLQTIKLEDIEGPYEGEYVVPLITCSDRNVFTEEEFNVLNEVWQHLGKYSAKDLSIISYKEDAYQKTALFQAISYSFAYSLSAF